jgi:hypothetical protein
LDTLLDEFKLPKLKTLHLAKWRVTRAAIAEKLAKLFRELPLLELERLNLISENKDDDTWAIALEALRGHYKKIKFGWKDCGNQDLHDTRRGRKRG